MLIQPVVPGQNYTLQIDVAPEGGELNLDDIGVVVTDKMRFAVYYDYGLPTSYISFADAKVKKLSDGWYRLTKSCSFTESMQVFVIGNFNSKSNKQILEERNNKDGFIITNIDNVSLVAEGPVAVSSSSGMTATAVKDSLYSIKDRHRGLLEITGGKSFLPVDNSKYKVTKTFRSDTLVIPDIAFDFDSYQLADRPSLVRQLQPLFRGKISKIIVEGFTDNKGSVTYNDTLSTQRAGTVANLLTTEFPLVKYVTESKGSGISNKYDDDSKNRRVEIIIFRSQE
jgi:flagellar motor protein MotB